MAARIDWCIVGGQAVNLWVMHSIGLAHDRPLTPADQIARTRLSGLGPHTSKDIDPIVITRKNIEKCRELHITSWEGITPGVGIVTSPENGHQGEILKFLPGVPDAQWIDRITMIEGWPVVPLDALYASKCWNFLHLPQAGRADIWHLMLLNFVLAIHLATASEKEYQSACQTFQQLADNGILTEITHRLGSDIASSILPLMSIPETPVPTYHVSRALYEEIRDLGLQGSNIHTLSSREEEWASVLFQFHDETQAQEMFLAAYGPALDNFVATL